MKINIASILLYIMLSSTFVACKNSDKSMFSKDNQIKFDTLLYAKRHFLMNDPSNPFCDLKIEFIYPIQSTKSDLHKLQQIFIRGIFGREYINLNPEEALNKYADNFFKNYESDATVFRETLEEQIAFEKIDDSSNDGYFHDDNDAIDEDDQQDDFYSYKEVLSNKIHFNESEILSFQVNQSNNKGRMATYVSFNNFTINLRTVNLLTENDIFAPGYDVGLQQLFINSLMQQNGVDNVDDLEDLGYFGVQEIMPNQNFLISKKGITYIFNKGEYSAYPLNAPMIFLPFGDLLMMLKEETVVSKLAGNK